MPKRRENIYKRKDGRWEARYVHHYEDGRACYRSVYGRTLAEVRRKRTEAELMRPVFRDKGEPFRFDILAAKWLNAVKSRVKESTYSRYKRAVEIYLKPVFTRREYTVNDPEPFAQLPQLLLSEGGVRGRPLSAKSVTDLLCVLKSIIKYGREIEFPVPATENIKYPPKTPGHTRIVDDATCKRLIALAVEAQSLPSLGILFGILTGMRSGEVCGLRWSDIDFTLNTIRVSRTVERIAEEYPFPGRRTKIIVDTPKTGSSERIIPLPRFLAEHLRPFRQPQAYYVLTGTPTPMEPHWFYRQYQNFLTKYDFPDMTFHALRHTFATRFVEMGCDAKALSEILGHRSVSTTLAIYVHPSLRQKREQIEKLVSALHAPQP